MINTCVVCAVFILYETIGQRKGVNDTNMPQTKFTSEPIIITIK